MPSHRTLQVVVIMKLCVISFIVFLQFQVYLGFALKKKWDFFLFQGKNKGTLLLHVYTENKNSNACQKRDGELVKAERLRAMLLLTERGRNILTSDNDS